MRHFHVLILRVYSRCSRKRLARGSPVNVPRERHRPDPRNIRSFRQRLSVQKCRKPAEKCRRLRQNTKGRQRSQRSSLTCSAPDLDRKATTNSPSPGPVVQSSISPVVYAIEPSSLSALARMPHSSPGDIPRTTPSLRRLSPRQLRRVSPRASSVAGRASYWLVLQVRHPSLWACRTSPDLSLVPGRDPEGRNLGTTDTGPSLMWSLRPHQDSWDRYQDSLPGRDLQIAKNPSFSWGQAFRRGGIIKPYLTSARRDSKRAFRAS